MGDYGIKILKPNRSAGIDVKNAQPKDLIILSTAESHKAAFTGSVDSATGSFAHNLGYIPFFQSYIEDANGDLYPQGYIDDQFYDVGYTEMNTTTLTSYQYDSGGTARARHYAIYYEN